MTFWEVFNSFPTFIVLVIIALSVLIFAKPQKSSKSPSSKR